MKTTVGLSFQMRNAEYPAARFFCGDFHRNRDHISINRHKFQSETRYLALHDCELHRTQESHCSPRSLSSPCRTMLNTARDSTRFVARLPLSTFIGREKKGHGGRACRLAHSGRIGSSLGIPSIQLSRITGDYFCPLTLYSTLFSSFTTENLKIFSELPEYRKFSAVESFLKCLA